MNLRVVRCLVAALLLFSARSVFAVDGQVLINESTVAISGGYPYHITQPGSYKLSANLSPGVNKTAISIDTSNVTLDLNGFTVTCNAAYPGAPSLFSCISDNNVARSNITIGNGTVNVTGTSPTYNFDIVSGISLLYSSATTVHHMHFDASGTNVSFGGLNAAKNSIVSHNTFAGQASPNTSCPSVVESNVNATLGSGRSGTGCVFVNNTGLF